MTIKLKLLSIAALIVATALPASAQDKAVVQALYEKAREKGFRPMRDDALEKVSKGLTDEAEVYRVLH